MSSYASVLASSLILPKVYNQILIMICILIATSTIKKCFPYIHNMYILLVNSIQIVKCILNVYKNVIYSRCILYSNYTIKEFFNNSPLYQ